MKKAICSMALLLILLCSGNQLFGEKILLKNATIFAPDGTYQKQFYLIIQDQKILKTGPMTQLKEEIYDKTVDLKNQYIYPAFIDVYSQQFLVEEKKKAKKQKTDKNRRLPLLKRKYHTERRAMDMIKATKGKIKKNALAGFSFLHLVPASGILTGTSAVCSMGSPIPDQSLLVPERFMHLQFIPNSGQYPSISSGIISDLIQIREDCYYYHRQKKQQFYNPRHRVPFNRAMETLHPYFEKKKRLVIRTRNLVEQRMAEILMTKLNISPVIILSPDGWRRPIPKNSDLILPLSFKAPMISKYTKMGEKLKKKSKKEIYPLKLAEFFKQHSRISLAPPSSGDYKGLIANIRILMKQGVSETKLLRALTMVPAKLLGIDRFAGTLAAGKLANLFISNKKIFEDKAKITLAFVEGREFNIPKASDKLKPPAGNISGNWIMKIESPMGNVESQLSLSQDNNQLEGKMTSAMLGSKEIENGIISGKEISWTITANMMGTESVFKFSAKLEDKVIKGQISLGSYGDATFVAKPKK